MFLVLQFTDHDPDEIDDILNMFHQNRIDFYITPYTNYGAFPHGIYVYDEKSCSNSKKLLNQYYKSTRYNLVKKKYQHTKHGSKYTIYILIAIFIIYLVVYLSMLLL